MDIVGALSIAGGGAAVLISAVIGSRTLLGIEKRKRRDDRIRQLKSRADAHRQLWYVLRQIATDEKREREERKEHREPTPIKNMIDYEWLRDYFQDNAVLLAAELHDAYQDALSTSFHMRHMLIEHEGEDPDLQRMSDIAKSEMEEYDRRYKEMGGFDPLKQ